LDELARLDIVAMHIEDDPDPARCTLHVFGRTYSRPHKYFYRRYAHQSWSCWGPISAEIEGDHLAPVIWRDRLYLFWVTFMDTPDDNAQPGSTTRAHALIQTKLRDLMNDVRAAGTTKQVEVQLHWSEYLEGEWSTPESSAFIPVMAMIRIPPHWERPRVGDTRPVTSEGYVWVEAIESAAPLRVPLSFNYKSVFIHVSKEPYENGEERGVYIHLGGGINQAFYLSGRNSAPRQAGYAPKPDNPYSTANEPLATRYSGSGELKVSLQERITTEPGKTPPKANPSILQQGGAYTLLPCDNNLTTLGVSEEASQNAATVAAITAAMESGVGEIASLMKPVFYQDNAHTFFVEPEVRERTIEEWQEWVTRTPQPEPDWVKPDWWKDLVVIPGLPSKERIPGPRDPWRLPVDSRSLMSPKRDLDWLVNPATALEFDGVLIGPAGRPGLEIHRPDGSVAADAGTPVNVNPGSGGLASGSTVVLAGPTTLEEAGLTERAGGLNIVGSAGFNAALEKNVIKLNRSGFGAGMPGR
jgi:hypothetical protein